MVKYLRTGAKGTSAVAAKDRGHLSKWRVIDYERAANTREERMQKDAVKAQKAKNHEIEQQAAAASKPVASSAKRAQQKATASKEAPLSLLSDGEETEGEVVGDESDSWGENWEDSFVDADDLFDPEAAVGCGIARLGVVERPSIITRSGRAVKTGHLIR